MNCVENVTSKCLEHNFIILYLLYKAELCNHFYQIICVHVSYIQELHQPSSLEFKTTKLLLHNPQGRKPGKNCNTCNTFQQSQEEIEVILITHFLSMMTPDEQTNDIKVA